MFYLLGVQKEDINAITIAPYEVIDEKGRLVFACGDKQEAVKKIARYAEKYPSHKFYMKEVTE